jgi:hypothetical protein
MTPEILKWLGVLGVALAVWGAFGQARIWWKLRFRFPRYLVVLFAVAFAAGIGLFYLEYQDEARPIAVIIFLFVLPSLVVLGFLLYGGPAEYVRRNPLTTYSNGVEAGSALHLRTALPIHDHQGRPTGEVIGAGEIWRVLPGSVLEPDVVWLEQPNGELHTWDTQSLLDYFERSPNVDSRT